MPDLTAKRRDDKLVFLSNTSPPRGASVPDLTAKRRDDKLVF